MLLQEMLALRKLSYEGEGGIISAKEVSYPLSEELPLRNNDSIPQVEAVSLSLPLRFTGGMLKKPNR